LVVSLGKGFKRAVDHGEAGMVSGLIGSVVQGPNHRAVIAPQSPCPWRHPITFWPSAALPSAATHRDERKDKRNPEGIKP